jgi:sigma-B regulation protein RsbU (phosphoserine phosphatase)
VVSNFDSRLRTVLEGHGVGGAFEFVPVPRGLVVGVMEGVPYEATTLQLQPGDRLVAYSDGVTEAESAGGEMFGDDRLRAVLDQCGRDDAAGLVEAGREAVRRFAVDAPQSDDITLLALVFRSPQNDAGKI